MNWQQFQTRLPELPEFPTATCALALACLCASQGLAQTYTVLHAFEGVDDGDNARAGLVISGNTLYGTTEGGGSYLNGTVFRVNTDGTGFALLRTFDTLPVGAGPRPCARLVLVDSSLYGTAYAGGPGGCGSVFKLNTNGTGFLVLKNFGGGDGANPTTGLLRSGTTLYGTTWRGGSNGFGTVFTDRSVG